MGQSISQMDRTKQIKWLLTIIIPILILFVPETGGITKEIKVFFAITVAAILCFAFELLNNMIPSLLLPFAYAVTNLVPLEVALKPWTVTVVWTVLCGFILSLILERIGLLQRLACWCILKSGGTYNGILYGLVVAGIVANLILPGAWSVAFAALGYGICKAFNLGKSKEAAGIMMTAAMANLMPGFFVMDPSNVGVLIGVAGGVTDLTITYTDYLMQNIIFLPFGFVMAFTMSKLFKANVTIEGKAYFKAQLEEMGAFKKEEKKVLGVLIFFFLFLITSNIHGIGLVYGYIFAVILLYMPGVDAGTKEDIQRVNYPFLFFITSCMSIGQVANVLGVGELISSSIIPHLGGIGPIGFLLIIWLIAVLTNFLLTPLAAMAALGAPITQMALDMGVRVEPVLYTFFNGLDQIIMPYEYALYMICFSYGLIHIKDFMKAFSTKMLISVIYLFLIVVPYWKLIGLL